MFGARTKYRREETIKKENHPDIADTASIQEDRNIKGKSSYGLCYYTWETIVFPKPAMLQSVTVCLPFSYVPLLNDRLSPLCLVAFYDGTEDLYRARSPPFDIVDIVVKTSLCC